MGIASVTILILAVLILALTGLLLLLANDYVKTIRSREEWRVKAELQFEEVKKLVKSGQDTYAELQEEKTLTANLRTRLAQIPLTPKPKENNNGPVQARTSGAVRYMAEQAFGKKSD